MSTRPFGISLGQVEHDLAIDDPTDTAATGGLSARVSVSCRNFDQRAIASATIDHAP